MHSNISYYCELFIILCQWHTLIDDHRLSKSALKILFRTFSKYKRVWWSYLLLSSIDFRRENYGFVRSFQIDSLKSLKYSLFPYSTPISSSRLSESLRCCYFLCYGNSYFTDLLVTFNPLHYKINEWEQIR
jgi:hypothetical protein